MSINDEDLYAPLIAAGWQQRPGEAGVARNGADCLVQTAIAPIEGDRFWQFSLYFIPNDLNKNRELYGGSLEGAKVSEYLELLSTWDAGVRFSQRTKLAKQLAALDEVDVGVMRGSGLKRILPD